ncbi:MAG: hypothetical protein HC896_00615 [Bacteroidales bacterium]|nr:hypothetical protein [Bacteroidales bacterium]
MLPKGYDREMLFDLANKQEELIKAVEAVNPNMVVVLNTGVPVKTEPWINSAKAFIDVFFSGQEAGNALANILFGKTNPSGKLVFSYIASKDKTPVFGHYGHEDLKAPYSEGIFVGYRYLDKNNIEPIYPFGFGLSYTSFKYSNVSVQDNGNLNVTVGLDVENTGTVDGDEVVQLYVQPLDPAVERPVKELKAFARVSLKAGRKNKLACSLITVPLHTTT